MTIKAIFFDFDGVIKESSEVKTEAFRSLYEKFGENISDAVVQHHLENGGISRYEKIKHCHRSFLNIDLNKHELDLWADKFSELVLDAVVHSDYVKGAKDTITDLREDYQLFVVSGTPQREMDIIIKRLGIRNSFTSIHGSPKHKDVWAQELIKKHSFQGQEILFVGDAMTDFTAALKCNLHFVLREHVENKKQFEEFNIVKIQDLTNFRAVIKKFEKK